MPTSFLCAIHLRSPVDRAEAARRLTATLGVMEARGLAPFPFAEPAWRGGEPRVFGATTLVHHDFVARTGNPFWGAGFIIVPAPQARATVITMTTPASGFGEPDDAWPWLTDLAEALCDGIEADLGLINGFTVRRGGRGVGSTPAGPDVAPGAAPTVVCPWMYWGASRLAEDGLTDALRTLRGVAYRSDPSPRGGWVLQAYDRYSGDPPDELLTAYAAAMRAPRPEWLGVR